MPKMRQEIKLLGTSLRIEAGTKVEMILARNVPVGGYFIRPKDSKWPNGIDRCPDDSILVRPDEIEYLIDTGD